MSAAAVAATDGIPTRIIGAATAVAGGLSITPWRPVPSPPRAAASTCIRPSATAACGVMPTGRTAAMASAATGTALASR
ncbi:hypothetical protein G6F61_014457 [Rhizopus arrhizus]|nr:hypothetical protein G6F61_014457 [Rhizopus arrhizus]